MGGLFYRIYTFFNQRKGLFVVSLLLFLGIAVFLLTRLDFNEDTEALMPDSEQLELANEVLKASGLSDRMILMIHSTNLDEQQLIQSTNQFINQIDSATNAYILEYKLGVQEDNLLNVYGEVLDNLPILLDSTDLANCTARLTDASIASSIESGYKRMLSPAGIMWKEPFINDPLGLTGLVMQKLGEVQQSDGFTVHQGYLMDAKKETVFLFLKLKYGSNETAKNSTFLKFLNSNIKAFQQEEANGQLAIHYYGAVPVSVGNANQIKRDINITVSIALFILAVFFAFYFRNATAFFIVFLPSVFGALTSIGILSLANHSVAVISLGIGAVLLGISVDYGLHVLIHLNANRSKKKMFEDITTPILMSSLTTAIAFLCLKIVDTKAVGDLGLFAGLSVFAAAIATLIILPQFFNPKENGAKKAFADPFDGIAKKAYHNNSKWVLSLFIISIFLLFFVPKMKFVSNMEALNYMSPKMKTAEQLLFSATGSQDEKIYAITQHVDLNEAIDKNQVFTNQLKELEENGTIKSFETVQDFLISESQKKKRIAAWNAFWGKENITELETNLNSVAKTYKIKPGTFQPFIDNISSKKQLADFEAQMPNLHEMMLSEYVLKAEEKQYIINVITLPKNNLENVIRQLPQQKATTIINLKNATTSYVDVLKNDLNKLAILTFIVVFIILLLLFGRIELALLTIVPIALSWVWTLGIMGLIGVELNITNIIITTFVFGLGVDYAIFITKGILHNYMYGEEILIDYKRGIFLSCLTTIIGLGALIFAQHPALKSIAAVSIIGVLSTVIITTSVLPYLLNKLLFYRPSIGKRPYSLRRFITSWIGYGYFSFGCFLLTLIGFLFRILPFSLKRKKQIYNRLMSIFIFSLAYMMFHINKGFVNKPTDLKPALYMSNHQSHLDILFLKLAHPKVIMLTNNWVWNSPFFGPVVRYADFYPIQGGAPIEESITHLKKKVQEGYSIIIFPEGTRAKTNKLQRFKKGVFYLAEHLELDIIPIFMHGSNDCIVKYDFLISEGDVTIKYGDRIKHSDRSWGNDYNERAKSIKKFYKEQFEALRISKETPKYFKEMVNSNYRYKGIVLPIYVRIKLKLANYFEQLHQIIPREGRITDLGCGYGYMDYILHMAAPDRKFTAVDFDEKKISIAKNNLSKHPNVEFICADVLTVDIPSSDAIVIWDVLHYLTKEQQLGVLDRCRKALNQGGMIIIRDGNSEDKENHGKTKWTEWFSTKTGFNQMSHEALSFLGSQEIEQYANQHGLQFKIINKSTRTSNHLIQLTSSN